MSDFPSIINPVLISKSMSPVAVRVQGKSINTLLVEGSSPKNEHTDIVNAQDRSKMETHGNLK